MTTTPVAPTVLAPTPVHATPISAHPMARGEDHPTEDPQAPIVDVEPSAARPTDDPLHVTDAAGTACTLSSTNTLTKVPSSTGTSDGYALRILSKLHHIACNLPEWIPEGAKGDMMARFEGEWPVPDDPKEAWEHFDPFLNAVFGWGRTAEEVAKDVRRGTKGMDGLVAGLEHCVVEYKIAGGLLEGKMAALFRAVHIA